MGRVEVFALRAGESNRRVTALVQRQGINFNPSDDYLQSLKAVGADDALLEALRTAGKSAAQEGSSSTTPAAGGRQQDEVLRDVEQGMAHRVKGSFKDAAKAFRAALKIDPDNAYVHFALATTLSNERERKSDDEVIEEYHHAIQLRPDFADAHMSLADFLRDQKDFTRAIPEYRSALRLESDHPTARAALGQALEESGDLDGAMQVFQEGVKLTPQYAGMHNLLAEALAKKGDQAGAGEQFRIAAGLPSNPNALQQISVGGKVAESKLIYSPAPTYPPVAQSTHLQGVVRLDLVIGKDGAVKDIAVISGHPLLKDAAVAAVSSWRYLPTKVYGEPVEIHAEVDVNFTLAH
jgi:TonB family protein